MRRACDACSLSGSSGTVLTMVHPGEPGNRAALHRSLSNAPTCSSFPNRCLIPTDGFAARCILFGQQEVDRDGRLERDRGATDREHVTRRPSGRCIPAQPSVGDIPLESLRRPAAGRCRPAR
jgi:hypothetical protein